MPEFLKSKAVRIATVLVIAQAAVLYSSQRQEYMPVIRPLAGFPLDLGSWHFAQEGVVDEETRAILKADDLLLRGYTDERGRRADLFVAAFRTQRTGAVPHSPKNCLPGSGYVPLLSDEITLEVGRPITVNRYVVAHGSERSLVLYWYQSRDRVIAKEYTAKFWTMADAIRLNRTDTALVRVVVPLIGDDQQEATAAAMDFVKSFFGPLREFLPA